MSETKIARVDLMARVQEIVQSSTNNPADEMRALGSTLIKIADALEGVSSVEARAIIKAVASLEGIKL